MPSTEPKNVQSAVVEFGQEALSSVRDFLQELATPQILEAIETSQQISTYQSILPRDSFDETFANQLNEAARGASRFTKGFGVRNTKFRGHEPKEETISNLRIISSLSAKAEEVQGRKKQAGGFVVFGTDQFIIQNASEQDSERFQIVETFGEPVAFFYGRKPRIYNYSGILFNSKSNRERSPGQKSSSSTAWRDNFKLAYELFLRGTKCVRFRARAYLNYDQVLREGYILNNQISQSTYPNMVNFSFSMFITREVNLESIDAMRENTLNGIDSAASPADATIKSLRQKTLSPEEIESEKRI